MPLHLAVQRKLEELEIYTFPNTKIKRGEESLQLALKRKPEELEIYTFPNTKLKRGEGHQWAAGERKKGNPCQSGVREKH
jgi:hypothetical protein